MFSLDNLTLQRRIGLLVLSGLAVGLGLFSWVGVQSVDESVQRTLDERLTIARMIAGNLDQTLKYAVVQLAEAADAGPELRDRVQFMARGQGLRETLAKSGIKMGGIVLADERGKVIQGEPATSSIAGADLSGFAAVKEALNTGQPTVSGLVSSRLFEVPTVLLSAPIVGAGGEVVGVLTGAIDVEQLNIGAGDVAMTVGRTGYTELVDGSGIVMARTRPGSPPAALERSDHPGRFAELITQGKATVGTCHRCHETEGQIKRRRDMLAFAPLSGASWGVAIRQSEEEALAPTRQLERRFLLLGMIMLVGSFFLAWGMMQGMVKPIRMLTSATKKVAVGDFKAAMPVKRRDEIGELSSAFSAMTQELARSREELVSRNEELSALNSMAVTVGQSLDLGDVLDNALGLVLEFFRSSAGCVFLRSSDGHRLEMASSIGGAGVFACNESGSSAAKCACWQVLRHGRTLMVNSASQCPLLEAEVLAKEGTDCFVSVPLKSKDHILGIMNIACSSDRCFAENDFKLLDSIGYHMGLAVENSVLYAEAKQKEKLRGQLLTSVINAQEDERKRIARELHDDFGQTLTGLIMTIESLENAVSKRELPLRARLQDAKLLMMRALEDLRRLTFALRPSSLDDLGLAAAIRTYAERHLSSQGIDLEFSSRGLSTRLAPAVETALFRIVQEATHNIVRHASGHHAVITLEVADGAILATIEDDGMGFDVDVVLKSRSETQSLGLLGMQERATLLGGTLTIESVPGKGTRLVVEIPMDSSSAQSSAHHVNAW